MSDLIDTTEMYLRTIFELVEEGVTPLRARIAERLKQSGPTVSQTVARMERDGLLVVEADRHLHLTTEGALAAARVMRRHRLAERLLTDVIGLEPELVHAEACRWEHVMSTTVERRLVTLLGDPVVSPYGNPIPALAELGAAEAAEDFLHEVRPLADVVTPVPRRVTIRRIGEYAQGDPELLALLISGGVAPGAVVEVSLTEDALLLGAGGAVSVERDAAQHIFVHADESAG